MKTNFIFDFGSSKEDLYLIRNRFFAVFDGFGSLNKFTDQQGVSGGLIASTIAKDVFSKSGDKLLKDTVKKANQKIRERMIELNIDIKSESNLWGTILAAVKLKEDSFEWVQIGDCLILVIYKDNSYKLLIKDYDHDEGILKIWKELAKQKKRNIREIIDSGPLVKLRNEANKTYGQLNGEEEAVSFINSGVESFQNIKHILLFTDGLIIPKENPSDSDDWELFVKLFLEGGLESIKKFVRNLQKDDPECWKYPRYKQYDDITGISISF